MSEESKIDVQELRSHYYYHVGVVLALGLAFAILSFISRTLYLLRSIRKVRQSKDPRTTISSISSTDSTTKKGLKTLIVLGSGGHTTEMLDLIKHLNPDRYSPIIIIVANTDTTSLQRVQAYPDTLPIKNKEKLVEISNGSNGSTGDQQIYRIPRSREVGQSYFTSVLTTLYSLFFAFWLVGIEVQPDLVLVNGPGTCLPIAVSAFFFRIIGWMPKTKIVFVESFCRVTSLSLTGKLLYPIADLFAVCWEQLHENYPLTYLITTFIPKTKRGEVNYKTK